MGKNLLNYTKYVWPREGTEGWALVFNEVPDLCQKIDAEQTEEEESLCDEGKLEELVTRENIQEHSKEEILSVKDDEKEILNLEKASEEIYFKKNEDITENKDNDFKQS